MTVLEWQHTVKVTLNVLWEWHSMFCVTWGSNCLQTCAYASTRWPPNTLSWLFNKLAAGKFSFSRWPIIHNSIWVQIRWAGQAREGSRRWYHVNFKIFSYNIFQKLAVAPTFHRYFSCLLPFVLSSSFLLLRETCITPTSKWHIRTFVLRLVSSHIISQCQAILKLYHHSYRGTTHLQSSKSIVYPPLFSASFLSCCEQFSSTLFVLCKKKLDHNAQYHC